MNFEQLLTEKFDLVRDLAKLGISACLSGNQTQLKIIENFLDEYFKIKKMYVENTHKSFPNRRLLAYFWQEDVIEFLKDFKNEKYK